MTDEIYARQMAVMHEITARARTHQREVTRIWELIPVAQRFWPTIGTPAMEDSSEEILRELDDLFRRCQLPGGMLARLCQPSEPAPVEVPTFQSSINAFIHAARETLHPAGPPAL